MIQYSNLKPLEKATSKLINSNKRIINQILSETDTINGLGRFQVDKAGKETLSFKEVLQLYNEGISKEEIQSWVWYKRTLGVPMTGWEQFFLKGDLKSKTNVVVAIDNVVIKDNHFRDIRTVSKGQEIGKYIKKHKYSSTASYLIVRGQEGLYYVDEKKVSVQTQKTSYASEAELRKLVQAGALFYHNAELLPYPIYTFGNMYDRELQLKTDKDFIVDTWGQSSYNRHEEAIKDAKPEMLTITSPDPAMRPIITAISDFASDKMRFSISTVREEYLGLENAEQFKKVNGQVTKKARKEKIDVDFDGEKQYSLQDVFIKWLYSLNVDVDFNKSDPVDIVDYYILNKPLRNDDLSKEEKAELKANARLEGEELFSKFLNEVLTFEDQQKLDYSWNRTYNGHSEINHARIPVAFECSAFFKSGILRITQNQREGVAFQELVGSGINAFDVGVGKTMTAIATLAMNIFNGKSERPLVVVPKPTIEKWINEIGGYMDKKTGQFVPGFLSGTGIKINIWDNLGVNVLKKIDLTKPVPKGSITVVTYEGFKRIGFGDTVSEDLFTELVNVLGQSNVSTGSRDPEIEYQKFRQMIGVGLKNTVADIDELGFDYLVVDEAHRAKNVFDGIKKDEDGNKRYLMQGAQSETGVKAFFITNYLQRKYGQNVMFLTATPFTNSPLEIFSMLSHVAYEDLRSMGINNIDTFFDLFVIPTVEWTANYKEEIVEKEVIKSFTNRLILNRLIYNKILYKTGEEAGVTRPTKINIPYLYKTENGKTVRLKKNEQVLTYLNMNSLQRSNQVNIVGMAQSATTGKVNKGQLFRALNKSLDNALSPYLVSGTPDNYKEFVENSPKIAYAMECIRSVKQWHEKRNEPCSGQVIYMNRGKAFFTFIREYLEKELGFKRGVKNGKYQFNEVEIISSEISETKKERIKEAFLDNVVKVIIGTSTIREGIDLQKNGTVLYNLYPDWNPTDIRQLEGRIWRQGNRYKYVRSVMPLVADSMDVFIFQKLEEKTARINDIWAKGNRKNVLDVESLDPAEIKLALITDVTRIVKMFFDQEKEELVREERRVKSYLGTIKEISYDINQYKNYQERLHDHVSDLERQLKIKDWIINPDKYPRPLRKKAKDLLQDIERYNRSSTKSDKDGMSITKRYVNLTSGYTPWFLSHLSEVISSVRKAERNILIPRGFTIDSNLEEVQADVQKDLIAVYKKAAKLYPEETFKADATDEDYINFFSTSTNLTESMMKESVRWQELLREVTLKKSTLNVSGKSAKERAGEFASLNHLLAERREEKPNVDIKVKKQTKETLDIKIMEAEAEAELLLLELLEL